VLADFSSCNKGPENQAFLDTGRKFIVEMTKSHKIDSNTDEQVRLKAAGKEINQLGRGMFRPAEDGEEGIGPLRVWPCGLAVSRSMGDYDCGFEVTAAPHVRQVEIPMAGARLILASDGLWDHITSKKACKASRKLSIAEVPDGLIRLAESMSQNGLTDDTSVLVVDMLPNDRDDFKDVARRFRNPANVIKRLVQKRKRRVAPKLLADYDGVENAAVKRPSIDEDDMKELGYNSNSVDVGDNAVHPSGDDDEDDLTVVGAAAMLEGAGAIYPAAANVSKVLDTKKLESTISA